MEEENILHEILHIFSQLLFTSNDIKLFQFMFANQLEHTRIHFCYIHFCYQLRRKTQPFWGTKGTTEIESISISFFQNKTQSVMAITTKKTVYVYMCVVLGISKLLPLAFSLLIASHCRLFHPVPVRLSCHQFQVPFAASTSSFVVSRFLQFSFFFTVLQGFNFEEKQT